MKWLFLHQSLREAAFVTITILDATTALCPLEYTWHQCRLDHFSLCYYLKGPHLKGQNKLCTTIF